MFHITFPESQIYESYEDTPDQTSHRRSSEFQALSRQARFNTQIVQSVVLK